MKTIPPVLPVIVWKNACRQVVLEEKVPVLSLRPSKLALFFISLKKVRLAALIKAEDCAKSSARANSNNILSMRV